MTWQNMFSYFISTQLTVKPTELTRCGGIKCWKRWNLKERRGNSVILGEELIRRFSIKGEGTSASFGVLKTWRFKVTVFIFKTSC